jgi:hypothetical protein
MEWVKKSLLALVLLLVVALIWVGSTIYFSSTDIDVNPNASSYTKQLSTSFDEDELNAVTERTSKSFSVSPSQFLNLTESSN